MKANMYRKLKCLTSAPARLSVAMPLIFGLATIAAAPTVEAVGIEAANIIDGFFDTTQDGVVNGSDDALDVAVWCGNHTPIRVDIQNGFINMDEDVFLGEVNDDTFLTCALNDENSGVPSTNIVDFLAGGVDVNRDGVVNGSDDATDIQLFDLP